MKNQNAPFRPRPAQANDQRKGWQSLLTLGYVKATEEEGTTAYTITASGKKALDAAK